MNFINTRIDIIRSIIGAKDYAFVFLALSLLLLPLSVNLSSFAIIIALGLKLLQCVFLKQKMFHFKILQRSSLVGLFFFCYILVNSLIQNNLEYTLSVFEKEISHLALLCLVPILIRNKRDNIILCNFFLIGLGVACVYVFSSCLLFEIKFNRDAFESLLDIHHTYICMYILFFTNMLLSSYFNRSTNKNFSKKFLYLLAGAVFFIIIFFLNSKVSIVAFSLIVLFYLAISFSKNNVLKYILLVSFLIASIFLFNKKSSINYESALDFRLEIWKESVNSIKEYPFFGNLSMNEKDVLNYKHYLNGKYYLMDSDLNSHNQYLSILLKYGLTGFVILSLLAVNLLIVFNKRTTKETIKEILGLGLIVLIVFFIENVLDRHHGIMFFSVFFNYYLVAIQNEDIHN